MNRPLIIVLALLTGLSIAGVSGLGGFAAGKHAERTNASADRRRAVERAELVAERKVTKAQKNSERAIRDMSNDMAQFYDAAVTYADEYAGCLTDAMVEDGFFDAVAVTEEQARAYCDGKIHFKASIPDV